MTSLKERTDAKSKLANGLSLICKTMRTLPLVNELFSENLWTFVSAINVLGKVRFIDILLEVT